MGFRHAPTMIWRAVAAIAVAGILWILAGRQLTLLADRLWTLPVEMHPITSISISSGSIRIGKQLLETGMDFRTAIADDRLAVMWQGASFVLGKVRLADGSEYDVVPDAGDEARLEVRHSFLSWPTPLEINFITGVSPSWKRHRYYHLSWKKPSGEKLLATWRYEQWRYSGGWGGDMHSRNPTGLVDVEIVTRAAGM
jgi:hypothetical protein